MTGWPVDFDIVRCICLLRYSFFHLLLWYWVPQGAHETFLFLFKVSSSLVALCYSCVWLSFHPFLLFWNIEISLGIPKVPGTWTHCASSPFCSPSSAGALLLVRTNIKFYHFLSSGEVFYGLSKKASHCPDPASLLHFFFKWPKSSPVPSNLGFGV